MCCTNILGCLVIISGIIAALLCVVGLAIPLWYSDDSTPTSTTISVKTTTYEGLWQKCTVIEVSGDEDHCENLWDLDDDQYTHGKKATLALCFIGVVCIVACVVVMTLHLTLCSLVDPLTKVAGILALVAGGFILTGVIVYGTDVKSDIGFKAAALSAGFGLCLASSIACIIIGLLCFFVD